MDPDEIFDGRNFVIENFTKQEVFDYLTEHGVGRAEIEGRTKSHLSIMMVACGFSPDEEVASQYQEVIDNFIQKGGHVQWHVQ